MMNAVHDGVNFRAHIRRPLGNIREDKEKTFPEFIHGKRFVRCIPVLKKSLAEKRPVPVKYKKNKDRYHNRTNKGVFSAIKQMKCFILL
jgi:hypothetical protein